MLRIVPTSHSGNAKAYFRSEHIHDDSYTGKESATGQWFGRTADLLGLRGKVRDRQWTAMCDNRHPDSGER